MSSVEKYISNFIETQFPEIYREEGPIFVEFVKKYYEWLESSNNTLYHSRRMLDYKDIDETVDDFVVNIKEKYLKEIQLETVAQTRQLVKHSLDLYRSKGTERSVDLFFRAIFGVPAEVYYPGDDIFRLSDGRWVKPKYLEVSPSSLNVDYVGKQIYGVKSDATAFVERYIRRKIKNKYINVLYISSINGEFETGETLIVAGGTTKKAPFVIGSMTTLDIVTGSYDFKVGDIVTIESDAGLQGKARVVKISDVTGIVDFDLKKSGWGYTANAEVLISEKVLTIDNVLPLANNTTEAPFEVFESVVQPLANIVYINANAALSLANGDFVYTYYSNNKIAGKGVVILSTNTTATNGEMFVSELIGNVGPATEPTANMSGTVSVSSTRTAVNGSISINTTSAVVNGFSTQFTMELVEGKTVKLFVYANTNSAIPGVVSINTSSAVVNGLSTSFTTALQEGRNIKLIAYANGTSTRLGRNIRKIVSIANNTQLTLNAAPTFLSNNTIIELMDMGPLLGTEYRRIVSIANDTQLTLSSNLSFVSNNTIMQLIDSRSVIGTGTNFVSNFAYGDNLVVYTNSSSYVMRTVNAITNATFMTVQEDFDFSNSSANYTNTISNNYIYTTGNTIKANISSRVDKTATGNLIGSSANAILYFTNVSGNFVNTNIVYQLNANNDEIANATVRTVTSMGGSNTMVTVNNMVGVFQPNTNLLIRSRHANNSDKAATAKLAKMNMSVGVIDITGAFVSNQYMYADNSQSNAIVSRISTGILAGFDVSNTLQYSESVQLNKDFVRDYLYIPLNALFYGFPKYPPGDVSTTLEDVLANTSVTIGGVASLVSINPGKNYDSIPFVTIYEPQIAGFDRRDYIIEISNSSGSFTEGEIIQQDVTEAKGIIITTNSSNSQYIKVKRLQFENVFDLDTGYGIVGLNSGVTCNVVSLSLADQPQIGLNASVVANVQSAKGSITSLEVVDSGFGYLEGENATYTSSDGLRSGFARINLGKKGVSEGFYKNKNGQLSDSKKLFDGEYYQEYSYEVRTGIEADKYSDMLKKVLHVAGTKMFSAVVLSKSASMSTNIKSNITKE